VVRHEGPVRGGSLGNPSIIAVTGERSFLCGALGGGEAFAMGRGVGPQRTQTEGGTSRKGKKAEGGGGEGIVSS